MTLAYSPNAAALLTLVVATLLTALIVPVVRRCGLRWGFIDTPDARKQHTRPMVRLGGVGIVLGFSVALALTWLLGGFAELEPSKDRLIWTTLAGCLCFFSIGLADDLFALPPLPRLALQLAVSLAVWSEGVRIGSIELPFGGAADAPALLTLPDWLSVLATVIWLVGITNAINWLDGLDGLAAGVSGIAAVGLLSVSFSLDQPAAGLLAAALAAISIVGPAKGLTSVSLLLPLLILSLPLADMSAVIMGRLSEGRSPFYPDRRHLHHRLLRTGLSHRHTVLLIYAFTQWLAALALVLVNAEMRFLWLALATAVLIWVLVSTQRRLQRVDES